MQGVECEGYGGLAWTDGDCGRGDGSIEKGLFGPLFLVALKRFDSRHQRVNLPFVVALDLILLEYDGLRIANAGAGGVNSGTGHIHVKANGRNCMALAGVLGALLPDRWLK